MRFRWCRVLFLGMQERHAPAERPAQGSAVAPHSGLSVWRLQRLPDPTLCVRDRDVDLIRALFSRLRQVRILSLVDGDCTALWRHPQVFQFLPENPQLELLPLVPTRHDGCRKNADLRLLHREAISALCKTRVKPQP